MKTKFLNLFLRVLTLGAKFLLSIYIVKYLGLEVNGDYGIFVTTITMLTYILGLDFYTYSTREILQKKDEEAGDKLLNQLYLMSLLYIVILPLTFCIWSFDFINTQYFLIFYGILIAEHVSTELYRVLVIFSKPILANLNLFLRSGIWIFVLIPMWIWSEDTTPTLVSILQFWFAGSILSILISVSVFFTEKFEITKLFRFDWRWARTGIFVAFPFFIGTLSYKIIQFADRYMVDYYLSAVETGTYIFYSNISMLVETFAQTTVVMIFSPKLVSSFAISKTDFTSVYAKFKKELILFTLIAVVGVSLLIYPLLLFVDKSSLLAHLDVFGVMVATKLVFNLSLLYHFYLYVIKKDKIIMLSTLIAVVVNLMLNFILIPIYGMLGSSIATFIGFFLILVIKMIYSKKHGL